MKCAYSIRLTQTAPLTDYGYQYNHVNMGMYLKPRKEVEKYASKIRRILGDGVKVEVIKHEIKIVSEAEPIHAPNE